MSRIFEELQKEAAYNEKVSIARQFLEKGIDPEIVSECTGLSLDTIVELVGEKSA